MAAKPDNQAYLSYLDVLDEEDRALTGVEDDSIEELRRAYTRSRPSDDVDESEQQEPERQFRTALFDRLHRHKRAALCFSGGGIRSATFGLGILQGLAAFSKKDPNGRPKLLGEFDFLSTVSGGGYLGSWFSAWATRAGRANIAKLQDCDMPDVDDGPAIVISELSRSPDSTFEPEPAPVRHLRDYTNYLAPRVGLLSADTWALAATVVRNLMLNWLVLLPLFAAVILIPVFAEQLVHVNPAYVAPSTLWFLFLSALAMGGLATGYVGYDLPSAGNRCRPAKWFLYFSLLPMSLAAIHLNVFWAWLPAGDASAPFWDLVARGKAGLHWLHFSLFGAIMHGGGMLIGMAYVMLRYRRPPKRTGIVAVLGAAVTGLIGGFIGHLITHLPDYDRYSAIVNHKTYTALGFPMVMALFLLTGTLLVGVTSYVTKDEDREWWARAGGWYIAVAAGWTVFASLVLFSTEVLNWVDMRVSTAFTAAAGLSGWTASRLGASAGTAAGRRESAARLAQLGPTSLLREYGARLILPLFLVLLTMLLAAANKGALYGITLLPDKVPSLWPPFLKPLGNATAHQLWLLLTYLVVSFGWSSFVNVNKFSLHGMYRQRLIRAYLGASNTCRDPNLFTGFDENDNIPMCALTRHKPLHVVNMALNLVKGSRLAWQQRKAESFTSTRLHNGSSRIGYRGSEFYGGRYEVDTKKKPITLGTAMTISGAAASPNMGYHSSPLLTIVMTLFNARLGWWLGNPKAAGSVWKRPGPRIGILPIIEEAFGLTDDTNDWIYLSDGGHFENLGLYEMVLRRCHLIVVSDASADPRYSYEDLANAVRKIRIDFGIPITFERPSMPMFPGQHPGKEFSGHHCAIGHIHYGAVDRGAEPGLLIYIKASMNGNEPPDVKQYAALDSSFPHQPTSDQFFDESQFESYRRLGLHVIEEICGGSSDVGHTLTLEEFRERALQYARSPLQLAQINNHAIDRTFQPTA